MIEPGRYTSGRIAIANLCASIDALQLRRDAGATVDDLLTLSRLLFLRGDVLGRIADHDQAEAVATEAVSASSARARASFIRAQVAGRFHRFAEAAAHLDGAVAGGYPGAEVEAERASLLQATGRHHEALPLRERVAKNRPDIQTLGSLAALLAEMDELVAAETCYLAALRADRGLSPLPAAQLLFEWGVIAMRRRDLDRADQTFAELETILPAHVPGRAHRAEVALARGRVGEALILIVPLLDVSDDPEYRATYAEVLVARGDLRGARREAARAAAAYEGLLGRRPEAYADHAAAFYLGVGNRPQRALELARANRALRDTRRARNLLARAERNAERIARVQRVTRDSMLPLSEGIEV